MLFGGPIPSILLPGTLPYMGSAPKPIPAPGNVQRFVHMWRKKKKKKGCEALCRQPKAQKPAPFYAETPVTAPGLSRAPAAVLRRPRLQLQIRQNEAKPSYFFLILERAEGDLSSPGALRFSGWESSSATPEPP